MSIHFNGQPRDLEPNTSVLQLLDQLRIDAQSVAVAVNSAVVPKSRFGSLILAEGDRVEVIEAVGGG